jgi:hypothetical protein
VITIDRNAHQNIKGLFLGSMSLFRKAASASLNSVCCAPACSMLSAPRRAAVNCGSACRSDTSGIARWVSAFDHDLQQVIRVIFARFRELGSARQVLLSMVAERIHFSIAADRSSVLVVVTLPGCDAGRLQQQAGQSCEHCATFKGAHTVPIGTAKSRRP